MDVSTALPSTAQAATPSGPSGTLRVLGLIGVLGGLLGALQTVGVLATPPMVAPDRYSYPFDAAWYTAAQVLFAVQHVTLLAVVAGLALLNRRTRSPLTTAGLAVSALGLLGLAGCELFALTAASAATTSSRAAQVNDSYGVPMSVIGVGLVLVGVGVARTRVLAGRERWLPLILGVYVFVVLFPAVFGPNVAGRLAIGVWMLLFAVQAFALLRAGAGHRPGAPQ